MRRSNNDLYYLVIFVLLSFIILLANDLAMPAGRLALTAFSTGYVAALFFYNIHNQVAYIIKRLERSSGRKKPFKLPEFQFRMIPDMNRKTSRRRSGSGSSSKRKHRSSETRQSSALQSHDATSEI